MDPLRGRREPGMKRTVGILGMLVGAGMLLWVLAREPLRGGTARGRADAVEASAGPESPELEPVATVREPVAGPEPRQVGKVPTRLEVTARGARSLQGVLEVPIEGLVHVPVEWELAAFQLELRLLEGLDHHAQTGSRTLAGHELVELPHAPGYFTFSSRGAPGRYRLLLPELAHQEFFDVGPGGRTDLRFEAPLPRVVLARCIDAASGAPLTPAQVSVRWFGSAREGGQINRAIEAAWKEELQAWRVLAPREAVDLTAHGAGYFDARATAPVAEGTSEVRLELAAAYELVLELRENGELLPWNAALRPRLVPAGGQPDHVTVGIGATSCRLVQRAGGPYSLEVDTPAGYRPILPVIVQLEGPRSEHVIELLRLR
ncbi:MAG: hypothetical protein ABL998_16540 [Planctomycetota bacterium]